MEERRIFLRSTARRGWWRGRLAPQAHVTGSGGRGGSRRSGGGRLLAAWKGIERAAFPGRRKVFHLRFNHITHAVYVPEVSEAFTLFNTDKKK